MAVQREVVGRFIDASVNDSAEALRLLSLHPDLRTATWNLGQNALHFLTVEYELQAVKFLLGNGFNANLTNEFGDTPLIDACVLGNIEMARLLLQHGADPNAISDTNDNPLHCATRFGNAKLLDLLISSGADPHYQTDLGETIFDYWPNNAAKQNEMSAVLKKHNIKPA